ncbi:MAG TPA: hypothetical protein VNK50_02250 [Calidithermus sp.]|nr:hypothetical protein [Calidithermus sp.]
MQPVARSRRPARTARGWVAAVGLVLGAVGAPGAQGVDEHARWVGAIEQTRGHLLASREVYRRGQSVRAGVHASHPIQELGYRLWRPVATVDRDLSARLRAALKEPGQAVQNRVPAREYDALVERTEALLERTVVRVVPDRVRSDPRFQARVIDTLLTAIDEEYTEGVAGGRVVLEIEYQDAWGFFQRLRALWPPLRRQLAGPAAEVAAADDRMGLLDRTFRAIDTPAAPTPVEEVRQALGAVARALAAAGLLGGGGR